MKPDLRDLLLKTPVSAITTVLTQLNIPNQAMRGVMPVAPNTPKLVGPAYTLRYIPSRPDIDNLAAFSRPDALQRRAFEECPEGHVLVVDARGDCQTACAGDMMTLRLKQRGVAGVVTDGSFRDTAEIAALNFPAFLQRPAAPPTFLAHHAADLNVPIGCGGVAVYSGDVLVGDSDGVVVIPAHVVADVAHRATDIVNYDEFVGHELLQGQTLFNVYPATDSSRQRFEVWRQSVGR